ncbi:hypothetical protein [Bradyrhizobium sp. CCBAU 51753]|uniref:hypothetical protein n=1 Tax=Bradyrhizobium sp. CCBAU 51753 TaxID=1325100 RepID=UPI00188AD661|nr:hypothetical protein [Bradyrhizobium sp. CCBAU 51753]QOZ25275.1 hypothetical protein XH93_18025 [Bradyrhizobium sp. CCBAU 51753]
MGFDLNTIEMRCHAETGVNFEILHPKTGKPIVDGDGKTLWINMSGSDASRIKSAVDERAAKREAEAKAAAAKNELVPLRTWQDNEDDMIEDLVLLTNGWSDNWVLDGKPFPFSKENAAILYRRFPEIAAQMTSRVTVRLNFLPTSASA